MASLIQTYHYWGAEFISYFQRAFPGRGLFFMQVSGVGDPGLAFTFYFPLVVALNAGLGVRMMWTLLFCEWSNMILKWTLAGDRPFWWIHETPIYAHGLPPPMHQYPITCETGAGNPSGHAKLNAAMFFVLVSAFINLVQKSSRLSDEQKVWARRGLWAAYAGWMVLVMLSRLYIAAHFPHQCLAGVAIGTMMASNKKRNYDDNYLDFGFTSITDKGVVKPQCVICHKILTAESLRPSKLRLHLETKHPQHVGKDRSFFSRQELNMKRQRLDASGSFHQQNAAVVEASFLVALEIAKKKKPHTIGEELILPCAKTMVKLVLGEKSAEKLNAISLSNNTVQRRISQISDDIREQVIQEIKRAGLFSIQLDESTDVQSCSQLLAFVRYVHDEDLKEEFLFCEPLEQSTKGEDVMQKLTEFFESEGLDWGNLCGICTDGAPAMLGSQSGFVTRVIQKAPNAIPLHCMIHRQALASKTLPSELQDTLNTIIKTVNFVKGSALNTRLFKRLCQDMDAAHETLLFHTAVRWLSKGNVVQRVFELREEISLFLRIQNKQDLLSAWSADSFEIRLAYLVDIFRQLNTLNLELQGKGSLIIDFVDKIKAFIRKMENWRRKVGMGNLAMLETVSEIVEKCDAATQNLITQHLEALEREFKRYFPDIQSLTSRLVRAPFTAAVTCIPDDNDDGQTELLTLQEDSGAKMKFETESLTVFWSSMAASYPNLCDLAFRHLLPFSSTYSCEAAFSQLLHIKTKYRNRLEVKHDLRCALSETKPRIKKLVDNLQHHPSH